MDTGTSVKRVLSTQTIYEERKKERKKRKKILAPFITVTICSLPEPDNCLGRGPRRSDSTASCSFFYA